tara:strand:- start:1628 stop:2266 length:639 start_codon:yes stop_codon:yes gene_type:complete
MSTSNKGLFISFEGIDGCGKSTQVKLLLDRLKKNSIVFKFVREPGGTRISEEIRKTLLSNKNMNMSSRTEALLMTASRAQLTKEEIIPAMNEGNCIVADRFKDSTLAYQGGGRKLDLKFLKRLNDFATYDIDPDLTFYIDVTAETAYKRSSHNNLDRIESFGLEFQNSVREKYLHLAEKFRNRIITIDGNQSISIIHSTIWEKTINCINEKN